MAKNNTIIFTGVIKKTPNCGISMKNHHFIERFKSYYNKVITVSLTNPCLLPFRIVQVFLFACVHSKSKIIISSNTWESNIMIRCLSIFGFSKRIYYWVPGGVFHKIIEKRFKLKTFRNINKLYVQSPQIVEGLQALDFNNVVYVPNSKKIDYLPTKCENKKSVKRFVFLSRIHPDKGCNLIISCAKRLNEIYGKGRFVVDFYGKIFDSYESEFLKQVDEISNVSYKGHLNLVENKGYKQLSEYDVMLFPTFWWGEGFPGVVIDAYIAGLPIIASDWNCNKEVVDKATGWLIPPKDEESLFKAMRAVIENKFDLLQMSAICQKRAINYDNRVVLSKYNLIRLDLLAD